ncbi:hypothetical protein ACM61V_16570 [Sphingomonas sp. TX0543]|uniref:hypothetical protein n=1 Tax=Sphingomonas sp. TX0543 TaxID=3399682 RepID=UPI003AFAC620
MTNPNAGRIAILLGAAFSLLATPSLTCARTATPAVRVGTVTDPNWIEGRDTESGDFGYHLRHFIFMTDQGPVVGITANLRFTVDAPSEVVWKIMKDFNTFEGSVMHYTAPWGDSYTSETLELGEKTFRYGPRAGGQLSAPAQVIKVIPGQLLSMYETIPADGGSGGISPGFSVVVFGEYAGKTTVTAVLQHAERLPKGTTEAQALETSKWGDKRFDYATPTSKWQNEFVPLIKKMAADEMAKRK